MRVRGPLVEVDEAAGTYVVALRPFHHRDGDYGRMTVQTTDDTEFEINGDAFIGAEGLRALAAAGPGTPTVAGGTLNVAEREFTADIVLAGSSVPGAGRDAVVGNVIARDGDILTVRGATIIPHDRRAHFHDDVLVQVGPDTRVFKDGDRQSDLGIAAISVGQRVTIRGNGPDVLPAATDASSPQILFDATAGAVRMHVTHLSGIVNSVAPGYVGDATVELVAKLQGLGEKRPAEEVKQELLETLMLRRAAEPEEIANAVVFFASDLSRAITGQCLDVNGGEFAH